MVQSSASAPSRFAAVTFPALLRLALLVGPLVLAIYLLHRTPVFCVLICVAVLTVWLTIDAGPFRAVNVSRSEPHTAALPQNRSKMLDWNTFLGRVFLFLVVFYSRLNI